MTLKLIFVDYQRVMNNCVTFYVSRVQKLAIGFIPKYSRKQVF